MTYAEINNPVNVLRHNVDPLRGYPKHTADVLALAQSKGGLEEAWAQHDPDFVLDDRVGAVETMAQGVERLHIPIEVQCGQRPPTLFQSGQMTGSSFTPSVRVSVEDTGPGASAWAREHLFEPLRQVPAHRAKIGGYGNDDREYDLSVGGLAESCLGRDSLVT